MFSSKVLEKAGSTQLISYMFRDCLFESMQSASKKHHSTETALVHVQNDIMRAVDQ